MVDLLRHCWANSSIAPGGAVPFRRMVHDAHGWWLREAGPVEPLPALEGELDADVLVVGGGYTGMWAAWFAKQLEPGADVVLLEADVCGHGPSGRNGGFVNQMWFSVPTMRRRFGADAALAVARAAQDAVAGVGRWCEEQEVDAWYRRNGYLHVSTTPIHDEVYMAPLRMLAELGEAEAARELSAAEVAERCGSPTFRGGAFYPGAATVHPARLALGLRQRLIGAGVRLFERSPMVDFDQEGVRLEASTQGGRVRAGSAVLASGSALGRLRPLSRRLALTSSHMLITEPVPDVLEQLGWTGGECITDCRAMLNYFRTTPDGRIAFGWGGGRVVFDTRLGERIDVDPALADTVRQHLLRFFPALSGRRIEHAWGGPIDVSPTHLPTVTQAGPRAHAAFGFTGNGVGPSHMCGRILASLALDRRDEPTRLAIVDPEPVRVPPEPFRYLGGTVIRRALLRKESAEERGERPGPLTRMVAGIPERVGIHIGR
jgi:glycine/D-amino acid oxidase-like deaminating enzyme